jgi:hypothetical protein
MRRSIRSVVGVGGLLVCLVGGAGAVAAGTETGDPGRYEIVDSEDTPGVRCLYREDFVVERVRVRAPRLYARDVSPGVDHQLVGWRIVVKRADMDGGPWRRAARSSIATAVARDDAPAPLDRRTLRFEGDPTSRYRVVIRMLWYEAPNGALEGSENARVGWYTGAAYGPSGPDGDCPGGFF